VQAKLAETPEEATVDQLLTATGMAMLSSMGGASGALFGTLFRAGGKALAGREALDGQGLADFYLAALEGVQTRGKAKPGDKTMVDALAPAAEAADRERAAGLPSVAVAAAAAAVAGRDASSEMVATMGRAKSLGQGSVGHPDAGACSIAIICQAMADFIGQA
jgi:dihydroxyacetone kinase-like protein